MRTRRKEGAKEEAGSVAQTEPGRITQERAGRITQNEVGCITHESGSVSRQGNRYAKG